MSLKHSQNKGAPHFPHDYPDCPAGVRVQEEQEAELLDKFKRSAEHCAGKEPKIVMLCENISSVACEGLFSVGTSCAAKAFVYLVILFWHVTSVSAC